MPNVVSLYPASSTQQTIVYLQTLDLNSWPVLEDDKIGWCVLVGVQGRLFYVDDDFHVGHDIDPFIAIGSGSDFAMGAMYDYLQDQDFPYGSAVVERGLNAAVKFSPTVCEPLLILQR